MKDHYIYLYFWLIPCICSFSMSTLIMGNVLFTDGLRSQLFQQLAFLLALSDVIQTNVTFLGDYGDFRDEDRGNHYYTKCCIQNYTLQFGVIFKTSIMVFIGGIVWQIVKHLKSPTFQYKIMASSVILPVMLIGVSIYFRTADVYCMENYEYSEETGSQKLSYVMLLVLFFAPLYVLLAILVVCCVAVKIKLGSMQISTPGIELVLRRLMLYPGVFLMTLIPATLLAIFQFARGKSVLALELMTAFMISFSGFLLGCVYLRHQKKFPPGVERILHKLGGWLVLTDESGGGFDPPIEPGSDFAGVTSSRSFDWTVRSGESAFNSSGYDSRGSRLSTGTRRTSTSSMSPSLSAAVQSPFVAFTDGISEHTADDVL